MAGKQLENVTLQIKRGKNLTANKYTLKPAELALDMDNNMLYAGESVKESENQRNKEFSELEHIGTDTVKAKGLNASPEGTNLSDGAVVGKGAVVKGAQVTVDTTIAGSEIRYRTNGDPKSGESVYDLNLTTPTIDGGTANAMALNNGRAEIDSDGMAKFALKTDMYGTALPDTGVEGDLFFLIS